MSLFVLATLAVCAQPPEEQPSADRRGEEVRVTWSKIKEPACVFHFPKAGRPYVHPLRPRDGVGVLTEVAPGHHKHQTGLYVGFVKLNGRDYFHNRGKDYFRRVGEVLMENGPSPFHATHALLDKDGMPAAIQKQLWQVHAGDEVYAVDLRLTLEANTPVTLGKHDYGGLFLRMPWKPKDGSKVTNSEGHENAKCEGKTARWLDVGMPIEGRRDSGRVAILDHKDNPRHPVPWSVDGQLGVGPALTRAGDLTLKKGEALTLRYRLFVYTGDFDMKRVEGEWQAFHPPRRREP